MATAYADSAFDGEGAARYTGRWNTRGVRVVYTAESLALATLELAVHMTGARVQYTGIQVDIPDDMVDDLAPERLSRSWRTDPAVTQRLGDEWMRSISSLALRVPSMVVDPRSGEGNLLINAVHPLRHVMVEVQRFAVTIDERLR